MTSDYQEAFSEAASSHSVGSDPEAENDDNLSDMVSANVSGRGTPSISGRDTPISEEGAAGSDDDDDDDGDVSTLPLAASAGKPRAIIVERVRRRAPNLPITVQRSNREDVTDRFGKFEIRQELESREWWRRRRRRRWLKWWSVMLATAGGRFGETSIADS